MAPWPASRDLGAEVRRHVFEASALEEAHGACAHQGQLCLCTCGQMKGGNALNLGVVGGACVVRGQGQAGISGEEAPATGWKVEFWTLQAVFL